MKHLKRYLFRAALWPSLGLLFVLVTINGLFSFIYELEWLSAWEAFMYVVTASPRVMVDFMPMAILLGTLMGMGLLANSSELTVIRAAGVSTLQISWMVLRPAVLLLALNMLIGEYVAPYTEQVAQSNRALAESGGEALHSKYGFWHREGDEFIHVNAVQPDGVLYGVTRYRYRDKTLTETLFVDRAEYLGGGDWRLHDVQGSRLGEDGVTTYRRETGEWETEMTPELLAMVILEPEHLSLRKLMQYARYQAAQGLEAGEYLLAFWQKSLQPVATLGMVLIALSFVFGPMREVTMGLRMTAGIAAGLAFHYGQQFFGHLSLVFDASPLLAAAAPPALTVMVGVTMLIRNR